MSKHKPSENLVKNSDGSFTYPVIVPSGTTRMNYWPGCLACNILMKHLREVARTFQREGAVKDSEILNLHGHVLENSHHLSQFPGVFLMEWFRVIIVNGNVDPQPKKGFLNALVQILWLEDQYRLQFGTCDYDTP